MKSMLRCVTAAVGLVGTVLYTLSALVVKQGFTARGGGVLRDVIQQAGMWSMAHLHLPLFQLALVAAGLLTLSMAPLGLMGIRGGRGTRAAGLCAGLGILLFGAMLAVNGFLYRPFFLTMEAMPGRPLYLVMNLVDILLMLGVLAANAGGTLLGVLGLMEHKNRDTLLAFLLFGTALVFAGNLMWQLFQMALTVKDRMLFHYFGSIVPLGAPYVWLAAVQVRIGMGLLTPSNTSKALSG